MKAILQYGRFTAMIELPKDMIRSAQIPDLQKKFGYDLSGYKLPNKRQVLRNCVEPELGLHIIKEASNDPTYKHR